jgi:hypothetical protein
LKWINYIENLNNNIWISQCVRALTAHSKTAEPGEFQYYFADPPIKDGKCDHYWGDDFQYVWTEEKLKESLE